MNRWVKGVLIGVGIAAASSLVILLLGREKPRRLLQERFQQLLSALPEREQVQQYAQQAATRVSQFTGSAKGSVQQTMKKVKLARGDQGEEAKQLAPAGD